MKEIRNNLSLDTKLVQNSGVTFGGQLLMLAFAASIQIFIARLLGPEGKGAYTLLVLVPYFLLVLGHLGIGDAAIYFLAKGENLGRIVSNALLAALGIGITLALIFSFLLEFLYPFLFKGIPIFFVLLCVWAIPFLLITFYFSKIFLGTDSILKFNFLNVFQMASPLLFFLIFMLVLRLGLFGAVISWFLAMVATTLVAFILIRKKIRIRLSLNPNLLKNSLAYGFKVSIFWLSQFFNYRLDIFLVRYFLTFSYVGYYSVSVSLAEVLLRLPTALSVVLFPIVSGATTEEADQLSSKVCRHMIFVVFLGSVIFLVAGKFFIAILFGTQFLPALNALRLLLPGILAISLYKILVSDLAGRGRPEIGAYGGLLSLGATVILCVIFIPRWGIAGAAIASSIAYSVAAIVALLFFLAISGSTLKDTLIIKKSDLRAYKSMYFRVVSGLLKEVRT